MFTVPSENLKTVAVCLGVGALIVTALFLLRKHLFIWFFRTVCGNIPFRVVCSVPHKSFLPLERVFRHHLGRLLCEHTNIQFSFNHVMEVSACPTTFIGLKLCEPTTESVSVVLTFRSPDLGEKILTLPTMSFNRSLGALLMGDVTSALRPVVFEIYKTLLNMVQRKQQGAI